MQRVLFVIPMLRRAGAECQLVALVNALPPDRFEKHVLSFMEGDGLVADINANEVTIHGLIRNNKLDISVGRSIGRIIDDHQIDVVHCTLLNAVLYGAMGRYFSKRTPKLVAVIHTTENVDYKHDIADKFFYQPFLKRCDEVWFVSSTQADHWLRKMPFLSGGYRVIHNGIDLEHFDPERFRSNGRALREQMGIANEEIVLCCVAGFRTEKLHNVLIKAFDKVSRDSVPVRLLLAGVGPTQPNARALVDALGLNDVVEFLGSLTDVRPLLAASDVKVLVSAAETFSMAMLEAMAMGLPVITTSVGGAAEAIDDGVSGYLVQPDDVDSLAAKISNLITDKALRRSIGKRARETVIKKFTSDQMVSKSSSYLASLSKQHGIDQLDQE